MEKIEENKRQVYALDEEEIQSLIQETEGEVYYNKKQAFLRFLRHTFGKKYNEIEFTDSDQLFKITLMKK